MPSLALVHLNAQGVHVKSAVQKWYRIETIGDDWVPNGGITRSSKNEKTSQNTWFYEAFKGSPGRARTYDKRINSPLLYQLSYRGIWADSGSLNLHIRMFLGLVSGRVV